MLYKLIPSSSRPTALLIPPLGTTLSDQIIREGSSPSSPVGSAAATSRLIATQPVLPPLRYLHQRPSLDPTNPFHPSIPYEINRRQNSPLTDATVRWGARRRQFRPPRRLRQVPRVSPRSPELALMLRTLRGVALLRQSSPVKLLCSVKGRRRRGRPVKCDRWARGTHCQ